MKLIYLTLFLLGTPICNAQKLVTFYYDADWRITIKSEAVFYRTCIISTDKMAFHGEVKDYYRGGQLQMEGRYTNNIKIDSFRFYYPNGVLEARGAYREGMRFGVWKYFYENGQLKQVVDFFDANFRVLEYYDNLGKQKIVEGSGVWKSEFRHHNQDSWSKVEGEYHDWNRHGKWKVYTKSGRDKKFQIEYTDTYSDDKMTSPWYSGTYISNYFPDKFKLRMTEEFKYSGFATRKNYPFMEKLPEEVDSLRLLYDVPASFPGGIDGLRGFVAKNLRYPEKARLAGKERKVVVQFVVSEKGELRDISLFKDTWESEEDEFEFESEAIRLVETFPKWRPAKRNGQPVPQARAVIITFSL